MKQFEATREPNHKSTFGCTRGYAKRERASGGRQSLPSQNPLGTDLHGGRELLSLPYQSAWRLGGQQVPLARLLG